MSFGRNFNREPTRMPGYIQKTSSKRVKSSGHTILPRKGGRHARKTPQGKIVAVATSAAIVLLLTLSAIVYFFFADGIVVSGN